MYWSHWKTMRAKVTYERILPIGRFRTFQERPDFDLTRTKQTHSTALLEFKDKDLEGQEADGTVFKYKDLRDKNFAVAVTTADCMPVIFLGKKEAVFLHAGWRGLANGILSNPLIAKIKPFYAFIGPSIELESFEVKKDFESYFPQKEFFQEISGKTYFDLHGRAAQEIHLTYPGIKLELSNECTFKNQKYHSWRRDKADQRNWNIFSL